MAATVPGQPVAGDKAPAFSAAESSGSTIRLSDFRGKHIVLYFYPKDNTPGCTLEAKEFRDAAGEIEAAGAVILGVSPDPVESHCKFRDRFDLNFLLLADEDHAVAEKYGVWVEKNMYGKKYMGVQRATFLINSKGVVAHTWPKVRPEGHAAQVLKALQSLGG